MEDRCGESQHTCHSLSYELLVPSCPLGPKGWGSVPISKLQRHQGGKTPLQKENSTMQVRLPSMPRPVALFLGHLQGVSFKLNQ